MAIIWAIILIPLFFVIKSIKRHFVIRKYIRKLPGPPSKNLFVGNISPLYGSSEKMFRVIREWTRHYFPIYHNWIGHLALANVLHPQDFEIILSNMKHHRKSQHYDLLHNWLGSGLLTSDGDKWQKRRKILTNSFHFNILEKFLDVFLKETEKLVDLLKKEAHKPFIDVTEFIAGFTLHNVAETAMGVNLENTTVNGPEYKKAIYEMGEIVSYKLLRPWYLSKFVYFFDSTSHKENKLVKILHSFTSNVIAEREKIFKPVNLERNEKSYSKRKHLAMLDLLLTAKREEDSIDDDGIRDEVNTFMFEGHDTTASAICFTLMLIACHPEVQNRIFEEMQQVFPNASKPNYKTLQQLRYMEMCIKEVLRIYPSVPWIARVLGEDIMTYSGHVLKSGSMVNLHIHALHENPDIYPNPEKFDPDRFLPENRQARHPFAYIPFSAGPRNCIGQKFALLEMKTVLCGVLSAFELAPVDTPDTITIKAEMVLRTTKGIRVQFLPRAKRTFF